MASELKTQFLNYMTLQRFSDHTKRSYVTGVKLGCVQNRPNMNFQCKLNQYITSKGYELPTIYSIFHLRSIKMHINVILVHHHSIAFPFL